MNNNSPASACSIEYKGRDAAFMKRFDLHFTLKPFSRDFEIKMMYCLIQIIFFIERTES